MSSSSSGSGKGPASGGPPQANQDKSNQDKSNQDRSNQDRPNQEGAGASSTSSTAGGRPSETVPGTGGPKKPGAIIDLKATEIIEPKREAPKADVKGATSVPPVATAAKAGEAKAAEAKVGDTKPGDGKPAAGAGAAGAAASKPADPKAAAAAKAPDAKPQPSSASAARPAEPRSGGSGIVSAFTHMAAGVIGGFLALLGADTISQQLGVPLPKPTASVPTDVAQRLAALEQAGARPAALPADVTRQLEEARSRLAEIEALKGQLATLTAEQSKLASAQRAQPGQAADGERLEKLEQTLQALASAAGTDPQRGRIPQLAALTGKMADLETNVANQIAAVRRTLTQEVDSRVQQVAEASEAARAGTQRFDRELSTVKAESARQSQRLETLKATDDRLEQTLRVVQEETGGLRSTLDGLKGDLAQQLKSVARPGDVSQAVQPVTSKLANLEQELGKVVRSEAERRANAERIVLSLELANLKRALDRGGAFAAELAAVKTAAGGQAVLAPLEPFKDRGVPTTAQLAGEFQDIAHRMIEADAQAANASVVDRLLLGAKSVVRVRRTEFADDDTSAEAQVARMEAAIKAGRSADVVAIAKQLSPRAQAPAKDWLAKVEARGAIEGALAGIEASLKSSLGGAGAAPAAKGN